MIDEGEVKSTKVDDAGEVTARVVCGDGHEPDQDVRIRQPAGLQAKPSGECDALILRDGRLIEVLTVVDREATAALPQIEDGQTRIHSLDALPQLISILSSLIKVGKDATRGAAREDDEVGGGRITFTAVSAVGPPPIVTINIVYTNAKGASTTFGPLVVLGTYGGPPLVTFNFLELIKTFSTLVKVQ